MATYTTPLKTLIEQPTQHRNDLTFKQRLEVGRAVLFDDIDYEFFNDMYRRDFEMKFIRHFYNKEIGFETEGQFKFQLETWLQIHMPYFNELFETQLIKYDPLTNIDMRNAQDITGEHTEDRKQDTTEGRTGTDTTQSSFEHDTDKTTDTTTSDITDQTTDTTTSDTTDQTTDTTGTSDSTSTSSNDTTATTDSAGSSDTTSNTTTDEDGRNIHSDTPDNRLQIVSDTGVIQYASEITETSNEATANTTSGTTTEDTSNTTTNATGQDDTKTDSNEQTIGNTEHSGTSETVQHSESDGTQNTKEDGKNKGWDRQDQVTKDDIIGSLIGDVKGTRLEKLKANRYGKDGAVTYQQMIQELRGTFIRIERDIFNEMTELFMLVY